MSGAWVSAIANTEIIQVVRLPWAYKLDVRRSDARATDPLNRVIRLNRPASRDRLHGWFRSQSNPGSFDILSAASVVRFLIPIRLVATSGPSLASGPSEPFGPHVPLCLPIDSAQEPSQVCGKCNDCYSE